ncbi:MAG TPA: CDP-glucose 4,6-dehydratase [Xanthobacteraceae bacterium]|nr:CDP-glucose 4,6-dehydratase [Xanthobacteraceae bacterium]
MESVVKSLATLRGRRVLVTGSTGFKGSWLCTWLSRIGADVAGFALPPEPDAPLFDLLRLRERIRQHFGDIRDLDATRRVVEAEKPEVVIHLAAQALVRRGYAEPKLTFDTNVGGGVNLLEAVRNAPTVRALVFVTSDKCYLNKEWVWAYRENDELGGHDPYSSSKAAAELVFACYQSAYFRARGEFAAASARAGNVIGGGDRSRDRILPDCVFALERREPVRLRNPAATRPWQHVLEPVSGYLLLAARLLGGDLTASGAWNFAPNVENVRTVKELAQRVAGQWEGGEVVVAPQADAPHEAQLLMLSNDKAKTKLGWHPRWDFARAVDQTVAWYREVGAGADPVAVTERQIAEYVSV